MRIGASLDQNSGTARTLSLSVKLCWFCLRTISLLWISRLSCGFGSPPEPSASCSSFAKAQDDFLQMHIVVLTFYTFVLGFQVCASELSNTLLARTRTLISTMVCICCNNSHKYSSSRPWCGRYGYPASFVASMPSQLLELPHFGL